MPDAATAASCIGLGVRQSHFQGNSCLSLPSPPHFISPPLSCLQLGVLRERCPTDSLEQAGELRLPGGEHDRRGPDLGVVPPQGIARKTSACHLDEVLLGIIPRRTDSKLFPLIPFCPRLQALGYGGRRGTEAKHDPMEACPPPRHFTRLGEEGMPSPDESRHREQMAPSRHSSEWQPGKHHLFTF